MSSFQMRTARKGLHPITDRIAEIVRESGVDEGLCTVFIRHTSASLVIQENADSRVCDDLEAWMDHNAPEDPSLYSHDDEGPDDMPSHIKAAITATSLSIPVVDGRLALGTWQGIYLWEHRRYGPTRTIVVHVGG